MRVLVALAVVAALGGLFVAVQASRGKKCHFNAHFAQKVVCTGREHGPRSGGVGVAHENRGQPLVINPRGGPI
jgi:hypothetical protein